MQYLVILKRVVSALDCMYMHTCKSLDAIISSCLYMHVVIKCILRSDDHYMLKCDAKSPDFYMGPSG